jgi:hypothetical protein
MAFDDAMRLANLPRKADVTSNVDPGPWYVEELQAFKGRRYWSLWKKNEKNYGGQEYLSNASRTDKKRFYVKEKAEAEAVRLNEDHKRGPK